MTNSNGKNKNFSSDVYKNFIDKHLALTIECLIILENALIKHFIYRITGKKIFTYIIKQ